MLIVSALNGHVIDFVGETGSRESYYLARWNFEPGVVSLRHVVLGTGSACSLLIMQWLGRQLGPGTAALGSSDCILGDIVNAKACVRTPAQAARQLMAVACFLRRMHLDGYTHNDLHDGNILQDCSSDTLPFRVIDLGSVSEAGHWKSELGSSYGKSWSVTRDWRAFALHFLNLVDGNVRNIWDLVGTNNKLPKLDTDWAVRRHVSVAVNAANGSFSQKWAVDKRRSLIINRGTGKALDVRGNCRKWKFVDGSIENPAKRLKLDLCSGIEGDKVIAHVKTGADNQMWHYDEISSEIVNPASQKVLDMNGEVRLPEEVKNLIARQGTDAVFVQLLEALFKARSDPNEICALVALLGSR